MPDRDKRGEHSDLMAELRAELDDRLHEARVAREARAARIAHADPLSWRAEREENAE